MENLEMSMNYRVEVDYYCKDYEDAACTVSSPYNDLASAEKAYKAALTEKVIDDKTKSARVTLSMYFWENKNSMAKSFTLLKNY